MPKSWPLILDGSRLNTFLGLRFPRARFPIASPTPPQPNSTLRTHSGGLQWYLHSLSICLQVETLGGGSIFCHITHSRTGTQPGPAARESPEQKPPCGPRGVRARSPGPGTQQAPPCVGSSFPSHSQGLHLRLGSPHMGDDPRETLKPAAPAVA